jgi:glycosyltransferase involved in cell wall biosynthesis
MAEHILRLLRDPEESYRMGRAGREFALQYGFENVKRELERIYF